MLIDNVLKNYPKVFTDLSKYEFPALEFDSLDLTTNKPVQSKIYRFPEAHKELVLKEMKKLLDLKIISHSKSHYNSPVWIVAKMALMERSCIELSSTSEHLIKSQGQIDSLSHTSRTLSTN